MAENFVGGIPFQLLYDAVKIAVSKSRKFRTHLTELQLTLDQLKPQIIQQINDANVQLNLPNDVVQGLQTKMVEGKVLVDKLLKLSLWNIRIWGNCYNCIGPDIAEELGQLDRSLRALMVQLGLEGNRNTTELIGLTRSVRDKQDELDKKLEDFLSGQQRMNDMLMAHNEAIGRIVSNSVQPLASSSGGGGAAPALGVVFQQLFDVVIRVKVKNMMFKRLLKRFESTLDCLQPLIEEIAEDNSILHLPEQEVKNLTKQIKNGVELVHKCSKVRKRANYKKYVYINKILNLNDSLQGLFSRLKGQVERDVKKAMDSANKIEAVINNIEASGLAALIDEHGSIGDQSTVAQPGIRPRDVIKEDSAAIFIDQEGGKPNQGSDVVPNQMETEGIHEVVDSTRNVRETMDHATVKGTLDFARNLEKIEGSGESQIEIAVAETEPPSPTAIGLDVHGTRDVKVTLDTARNVLKLIECEIATAEPLSSSPAVELTLDPTSNTKAEEKKVTMKLTFYTPRGKKRRNGMVIFYLFMFFVCNAPQKKGKKIDIIRTCSLTSMIKNVHQKKKQFCFPRKHSRKIRNCLSKLKYKIERVNNIGIKNFLLMNKYLFI